MTSPEDAAAGSTRDVADPSAAGEGSLAAGACPAQAQALAARISSRAAVVGVLGMGYVGLPVAAAMVQAGFSVLGFDIDESKVSVLNRGECYLEHLGRDFAGDLCATGRFEATSDMDRLTEADALLVCVPTPLAPGDVPDLGDVTRTMEAIAERLRPGQLVVLESTTYPRTTRDVVKPILDRAGLECGHDYFLAYSPEREDPGRQAPTTASIPRLVGALDSASLEVAAALYAAAVHDVVRVSSAEVAEAAKLLENIYRAVNIAMVNEMKTVLTAMDIDINEVVDAAATKPFGFQEFRPGPGLGGHCIPIDPFYLAHAAQLVGMHSRFIELAGEVNRAMPAYVIERLRSALVARGGELSGARVLVLGLAYKRDVNDVRGSPSFVLLEQLREAGARVAYHDPHVPEAPAVRHARLPAMASLPVLDAQVLAEYDAVIIATDHSCFDYELLLRASRLVVDARGATRGLAGGDIVVA
jgi:UDP-N-acetyl-D-glucosamine dehydrogenase